MATSSITKNFIVYGEEAVISGEKGIMEDRVYSIDEIREKVVPIAEAYGVERVFLFGSYAQGKATADSDIDLRVDKGKVKGFAFGGLYNALLDTFEKSVDIVTTMSLDAEFLKGIADEEVLLYGE